MSTAFVYRNILHNLELKIYTDNTKTLWQTLVIIKLKEKKLGIHNHQRLFWKKWVKYKISIMIYLIHKYR